MTIAERMVCAIDDANSSKPLSALQHACAAVDGTGAKLFPEMEGRNRFVRTFEKYIWIVEPMLACGIILEETVFKWVTLKKRESKFSEIVYEIFRCNLAHGTELPSGFKVEIRKSDEFRKMELGQQTLKIPDTIIFAMLGIAVFSEANRDQKIDSDYWLSCGSMRFPIDSWWGRENDARICFSTVFQPRVKIIF